MNEAKLKSRKKSLKALSGQLKSRLVNWVCECQARKEKAWASIFQDIFRYAWDLQRRSVWPPHPSHLSLHKLKKCYKSMNSLSWNMNNFLSCCWYWSFLWFCLLFKKQLWYPSLTFDIIISQVLNLTWTHWRLNEVTLLQGRQVT